MSSVFKSQHIFITKVNFTVSPVAASEGKSSSLRPDRERDRFVVTTNKRGTVEGVIPGFVSNWETCPKRVIYD